MSRILWDQTSEKLYETGVDRGVVYPQVDGAYPKGYGWNGLTAFNETPSGAEPTALYADNVKYLNLMSNEDYGFTMEAYTYPPEFAECDGSKAAVEGVYLGQQTRKAFGFSCRTLLGNDTEHNDHGYKLHLVYGALAAPSEKSYATVNDSPEAITFSWDCTTTPVEVPGFKPTASITIDSTKCDAEKLKALEDVLYGSDDAEPTLPMPSEVLTMLGFAPAA